jgi:hypothetical protein
MAPSLGTCGWGVWRGRGGRGREGEQREGGRAEGGRESRGREGELIRNEAS